MSQFAQQELVKRRKYCKEKIKLEKDQCYQGVYQMDQWSLYTVHGLVLQRGPLCVIKTVSFFCFCARILKKQLMIFSTDKRGGREQSFEEYSNTRKCLGHWFSYCALRGKILLWGSAHWQLCYKDTSERYSLSLDWYLIKYYKLVFLNWGGGMGTQTKLVTFLPFTY